MTVRPGMTKIVAQLRQWGQASRTDQFNDETFWTDEQLQEIADNASERLTVKLLPIETVLLAERTLFSVQGPRHYWYESDTYGVMQISDDDTLILVPTSSVYDATRQEITFAESLSSRFSYALEGLATNFYIALADLWEQKAAQRYDFVDFKAGNNKTSLSQEYQHCLDRAKFYRNKIIRRYERTGSGRWAR